MNPEIERIKQIKTFPSLVEYLREELNWQIEDEDIEDLTFEYEPEELGIDKEAAVKIKEIKQLRPMVSDQPWGIFLIDFASEKISVTAMRLILRAFVSRKRASANESDRQRFALGDLLFIIISEDFDKFDFAYFRGKQLTRATLSIFGWRTGETHLRTLIEYNLPKLRFPSNTNDKEAWLKQWREAFDVEKVTSDFFNSYKAVFLKVELALKTSIPDRKPDDKEAQETRRLFAQRLFNRLMFIYFLQKKGWLSFNGDKNYLQTLFSEAKKSGEEFFSKRLYYLFFHGLSFAGEASESKAKTDLEKIVGNVPYLNGGLFEIEDDLDVKNRVELPNELFADILEFFSRYNFTIEESTPFDVQVAVDPEMLGKVFEELITGRHASGSYYTPRPVVSFMYRESLKNFLAETDVDHGKLRDLIDFHKAERITVPEAETLLEKLDKLKVVDPACGSGAYLLGCLQELFIIRQKLDTRSREATSKDDYHRKLRIIQQNIHGVDLDNFAVQIARLRLWLSLIVDFEGDIPEPLPNLNFKIEPGDSLTSPNPNDAQGSLFGDIIREFAKAKSDFFLSVDEHGNPISTEEKESRRKNADEKRETLRKEIADWRSVRGFTALKGFDWQVDFGEVFLNGGFDIVLANPPYGAESTDKTLRENFFGRGTTQSKDTYGLFIARGLELLRPNGTLCYIVSDTWRTIKSHKPLRRRLLEETTVKHFVDLPSWIFDAVVNTNILTVSKTPAPENHRVVAGDLHNLPNKDWDALYKNLEAVAEHGFDAQTLNYARYTYPQSLISTYDNLSFFVASPKLYELMSDVRFQKLGAIAEVKQGLATADNAYYLRKREGVRGSYEILDESKLLSETEITTLTDDEKRNGIDPKRHDGKHFLPFDKGGESDSGAGWMPNYHVPTGYFIDWSKAAVQRLRTTTIAEVKTWKGELNKIKTGDEDKIAAVFRNPQFYFRYGLTFSPTGIYSPSFRLGCNAVFGNKGSTIFFKNEFSNSVLGNLTSTFIRYALKSFLSHTVETGEEVLLNSPLVEVSGEDKENLENLVSAIIEKQKSDQFYPYHLHEQREIDTLIYQLYGLDAEDLREVEIWYCRRYDRLAKAQGFWAEVETKYADYLEHRKIILSKPASFWNEHPIRQIIAKNEGSTIEFKEQLENTEVENAAKDNDGNKVLRAICSFLNAEGGTVLIGVNDKSLEIVGIETEMSALKLNKDQYKLKLEQMIESNLIPKIIGNDLISVYLEPSPQGYVCQINVKPSREAVFYKDKHLFVRYGSKTQKIEGAVAMSKWAEERKLKFKV